MTTSKDQARKPINKRWPGQWCVRAAVYTPGPTSRVAVETDMVPEIGEAVRGLLLVSVLSRNSTELLDLCAQVTKLCAEIIKRKKDHDV